MAAKQYQQLTENNTNEPPQYKPLKGLRKIPVYFAFLLPLVAALAKAFTNSYSALSIFVFFVSGSFFVSPALFAGPVFIVTCLLGTATVIVSLNMEGRSLYKAIYQHFLNPKPPEENFDPDPLDIYIINPFSIKNPSWKKFKKFAAPPFAFFLFFLSSMAKGLAMAPGIFNILGLASCGPWGWVILVVAMLAVMGVSAAKEGKKLLKEAGWERWPCTPPNKGVDTLNRKVPSSLKKWSVYILSSVFPLIAALAKAFGYSYGLYMLLAYSYTGSFSALAAVSAYLPLIIVVGIAVALVSLRMEGYSLFKLVRRLFITDEDLGLSSKYYTNNKQDRAAMKRGEEEDLDVCEREIKEKLAKKGWVWAYLEETGSFFCKYIIGWGLPLLTFVAKSSIMMVGSISAIVLLTGCMPITWWLLVIGAVAGVTVGSVSLLKEGVKTHDSIRKYYILYLHRKILPEKTVELGISGKGKGLEDSPATSGSLLSDKTTPTSLLASKNTPREKSRIRNTRKGQGIRGFSCDFRVVA